MNRNPELLLATCPVSTCFDNFRHISTLFKSQAPVLSSHHLVDLKPSNLQWFKLGQNWSLFASPWEPHLQKSSNSWPSAPSWCTRMLRCYRVHWVGTVIRPVANRQKVNVSLMLKDADGTRLSIPVYTSVQHHCSIVLWTWHLLLTIKWYATLVAETCWKPLKVRQSFFPGTDSIRIIRQLGIHGIHRQKSVTRPVSGHGHSSASCGPVAPLLITVFSLWQAALMAFGIDIPTAFPLKASKSYKLDAYFIKYIIKYFVKYVIKYFIYACGSYTICCGRKDNNFFLYGCGWFSMEKEATRSQNTEWLQHSSHLRDKIYFCRIHRN